MRNTVKRISILASAFVMAASILFTGMSASADKAVDVSDGYASETIHLSDAEAIAGNQIMVQLSLNTGNTCLGYNLDVEFDSNLTLVDVEGATTWEVNGNVVTVVGFSGIAFKDGATVAKLYFETPEVASEGSSYGINVSEVKDLAGDNGVSISETEEIEVKNSTVEVVEEAKEVTNYIAIPENSKLGLRGDANDNGKVDLYDAIKIARYMLKAETFTEREAVQADANQDGKVDIYDAIAISSYTLMGGNPDAWASVLK